MAIRRDYLAKQKSVSDSDIVEFKLKGRGIISAIDVIYEATNGSTSNQGHPIHKDVSKIEVIDGSESLWSLSMVQAQALDFYMDGKMPPMEIDERGGQTQLEMARILFGRWLGDREYAFDPEKFDNPVLRCIHELTISSTAGFASGSGKLTVIAHIFEDERVSPKGYLRAIEVKSFTSEASGDEETELPQDLKIRMLLIRAYESGVAWDTDITNVKVDMGYGKKTPWDIRAVDLKRMNIERFGLATISQILYRTDGDSPELFLAYPEVVNVNAVNDMSIASYDAISADTITLQVLDLSTSPSIAKATADRRIDCIAQGAFPHHVACIPFGEMDKPETWLDPKAIKPVRVILTQGGAGAAVSIFVQQLKPY